MTNQLHCDGMTGNLNRTSGGRNLENLADPTTTTAERNIPEVISEGRLTSFRDHRLRPCDDRLINGAGPGQASKNNSGPTDCKHSLMEGSHMNGWRQTQELNVHGTHTSTCREVGKHILSRLGLHSLLPALMQASPAVWKCRFPHLCLAQKGEAAGRETALIKE